MSSNSATRHKPSASSIDEKDKLIHAVSQSSPLGKGHGLCTGHCPLSLSRYLLSTTLSSISTKGERNIQRESTHTHTAEDEFEPASNLNQCQNTLRDDVESSILTRWLVTVGHEESIVSLYPEQEEPQQLSREPHVQKCELRSPDKSEQDQS